MPFIFCSKTFSTDTKLIELQFFGLPNPGRFKACEEAFEK